MWVSRLLFVATLTQRFGSAGKAKTAVCRRQEAVLVCRKARAVNLIIHFHMLFLDGVYIDSTRGSRTRFRRGKAPTSDELTQLTYAIARRIAHYLERQGLLERDVEGAWLTSSAGGEENEAAIHHLRRPILMEPRM